MYKIEDIFNWRKLEQWKNVIDNEIVGWEEKDEFANCDVSLQEVVELLQRNCLPIAIICCIKKDKKKVIYNAKMWKELFEFINNNSKIKVCSKEKFFHELTSEERDNILKADIFSIWVKED